MANSIQEIKANLKAAEGAIFVQNVNGEAINLLTDLTARVPGLEYVEQHDFYILYDSNAFTEAGYRFATAAEVETSLVLYDHDAQSEVTFTVPAENAGQPFQIEENKTLTFSDSDQVIEANTSTNIPFTQEIILQEDKRETEITGVTTSWIVGITAFLLGLVLVGIWMKKK